MGYVIAGILVLLIVAGFVTFLVMNTMRKAGDASTDDPSARQGERGGTPGIGEDPTPLGDTTEHAGEQSAGGATESDPEAADRGIDPAGGQSEPAGGEGPQRPARPEDRQLRDSGAGSPASERLADRPR
jgi:hypothetical protein